MSIRANQPVSTVSDKEIEFQRFNNRLNDIRLGPLKQLPMTLIMMFMVGNSVSIFSIMFVGMAVVGPIQSMFNVGKLFGEFYNEAGSDRPMRSAVLQSKAIYICCCLVALIVALVKVNWMGLLPINAEDWMIHTPPTYAEYSTGTFFK